MGLKELYTATGAKIFDTASTVKTIGAAAAASAVIAGAAAGVHAFTSGRDFTPDGAGRAIRTNQVHFDGSENTIGKQDEQTKNGESEIYERDESAEEKQKPQTGDSASYLFENVKQQEKPSGLLDRDGTAAAIAGTVPTAGAASVQPGMVLDIVKDPAAADIVLQPGNAAQAAPPTGGDTANSGGNTAQPSVTPANPSTGGDTAPNQPSRPTTPDSNGGGSSVSGGESGGTATPDAPVTPVTPTAPNKPQQTDGKPPEQSSEEKGPDIPWFDSGTRYDGTVTLPASGVQTVTLTATVTDTDGTVKTRDYTLTVYSAAAAAAEARLAQAAQTLGETFEPAYGKDTNAADALAALLASKGYDDVTVTVKAAAGDAKASIDADGTIHYYFDAGMSSRSSYFYATFVLSLDGASVEKEVYVHITWDLARAQAVLQAELDRITLPTEPVTSLTLPRYPVKEGIDPSQVDYSKYDNFNTWATVTWTSANDQIVKVGSAPYTPYYAPYATTLTRTAADQQVTLTASIVCNSIEGLTLTKAFTVTVAASQESQATLREQLQAKLDAGFAAYGGLRDAVTGEPLEERDGKYIAANDIHFPTTGDFGVDGKYTPVIITSSDADTIVPPGVNNAARVEVYRPLPGEDAKDVTVTVTIKDKETGIAVSRDFVIAVQPLTQQEIDAELALMAEVKAHYFDGIRNGNPDPDHITGNLHAFREAYLDADGQLVWVYDIDDQANHGIVPSELPGWQASERWRLLRSSNPAVISHENLLVTRATEHKAVTIVSELSSETLGKYAARYPDNADFQALSHQAVSARLIVRGTAPTSDEPQVTTSTVTFQLHTDTDMWIQPTIVYDQPEGTTAMDVFRQVLTANGYSYEAKGSYVQAVIKPDGTKVAEFSKGPNSGWVFRVNGEFPDVAMQDYQISDGDVIEVLFTANYMDEPGLFLPFTDVNNHWAYSAIKRVYNRGLMLGVSDTRFAPNQALSRAMLVTVLYRLADEPDVTADNPFTDVPAGQWYTNAVIWAAANGIVSGFGDGTFRPNALATRAQAAVMLCGYAKLAGRDTTQRADLSAYADAAEIPSWALAEMQWANAAQLIRGRSDTILAPNAGTTRAEMAKILSTFIGK